jgi:hypothetical protein
MTILESQALKKIVSFIGLFLTVGETGFALIAINNVSLALVRILDFVSVLVRSHI